MVVIPRRELFDAVYSSLESDFRSTVKRCAARLFGPTCSAEFSVAQRVALALHTRVQSPYFSDVCRVLPVPAVLLGLRGGSGDNGSVSFAGPGWPPRASRAVTRLAAMAWTQSLRTARNLDSHTFMEKRVLIAVVLSFVVLYAYQAMYPPPKPVPAKAADASPAGIPHRPARRRPPRQQKSLRLPRLRFQRRLRWLPTAPSAISRWRRPSVSAVFTTRGGALKSWRLKKYQGIPRSRWS